MMNEDVSKYLLAYRKEANTPGATQPGWSAKVAFAKQVKNAAKAVGAAAKATGKRAPITPPPPPVAEASQMLPMLRPPSALAPIYKANPAARTGLWKKLLGGTLLVGGAAGAGYGVGSAKKAPSDPIPAPPTGKGLSNSAVAGAAAGLGGLGLSAYLLYRVLKRKNQAEE